MEVASKDDLLRMKDEILSEIQKLKTIGHPPSKLLRSNELCELLQMSQTKLYELRRSGKIPCVRIGGNYLYDLNEVLERFKIKTR